MQRSVQRSFGLLLVLAHVLASVTFGNARVLCHESDGTVHLETLAQISTCESHRERASEHLLEVGIGGGAPACVDVIVLSDSGLASYLKLKALSPHTPAADYELIVASLADLLAGHFLAQNDHPPPLTDGALKCIRTIVLLV
jgi:hypothetical protein